MKVFLTLLLLGIWRPFTSEPLVIQPGDRIIRYDRIRPAHEFYKNVIRDSAGNIRYEFMMENMSFVDSAKGRIIFARSRQVPAGQFSTDTSVTDLQLKPVRMHEIHYQRGVSFDMEFGATAATVITDRKGVMSTKEYPMKAGYFEDNMIEYIFGWLALKKGVVYRLDNFNKDTPEPSDPYELEYVFDDEWDLAPGHRTLYRVFRFVHGKTTGHIWIDNETNSIVKTVAVFPGGSYFLTRQ
ncbi:hypothetical protein [Puia sp.]|jgi:hypothetical protein|uniref:hypothetical protein n=1 Tax=Puia sp. TaxID=2045100 RepID=UPI002F422522